VALLATRKKTLHARGIERRARLLEVARTLLETRELDELTLGEVAAEAGVPKGSAYFFYADIEDLYMSLQSELQIELIEHLRAPIRQRLRRWQEVTTILNARGMAYYSSNPAARRLQIGPKTSPELKQRDRRSDLTIGELYERHIDQAFVLPQLPQRVQIFFRAVEIADLMFSLSVLESGIITPAMCGEANRAANAYLESYLPATLPRRKN